MGFWSIAVGLALEGGIWALNKYLLADDSPKKPPPEAVHIANTQEGVAIPIVYGSMRLDQPILAWYGNVTVADGEAYGVEYIYGVDMIFILGIPTYGKSENDARGGTARTSIRRMWWGDVIVDGFDGTTLIGPGYASSFGDGYVDVRVTSGGGQSNIPVCGVMQLRAGTIDQDIATDGGLADVVLTAAGVDRTLVPGFRNQIICTLSFSTVPNSATGFSTIGANAAPPQISFEVCTSIGPNAFTGTPPQENPVDVILDLLTAPVWKVGMSLSDIDTVNFQAVASVLTAEGATYSAIHNSSQDATQIIIGILKQIDGMIYQEPTTGKLKIKLVRKDYNPLTIPTITADNTVGKPEYTVASWSETYNQVRVKFPDVNQNYQQGSVLAQNLSVLGMQSGRLRTLEIQYQGVTNAVYATKLASRELAAASKPLAKATCTLQPSFYGTRPGDVFSVSWPKYGVTNKVMRVLTVDLGSVATSGVKVTMIEDAFDQGTQYGTVGPSLASTRVYPLTKRLLLEAPRYTAVQLFNSGQISDPEAPRILTFAMPDDTADSYELDSESTSTGVQSINALNKSFGVDVPTRQFPATFTLVNNYSRTLAPYDTTSNQLVITNLTNWPSVIIDFATVTCTDGTVQFALVNASGQVEIISFESVTNLGGSPIQYRLNNVWRGLLDTVPIDLAAGDRGWFVNPTGVGRLSYKIGNVVTGQAIPHRGQYISSKEDPTDRLTISCRALRPYPAANQGVGGDAVTGTLGLPSVANRNKVATFVEEGIDLYGTKRDRQNASIVRGDQTDDTLTETITYAPLAVRAGGTYGQQGSFFANAIQVLHELGSVGVTVSGVLGAACWLLDGYGSIDVGLQSSGPYPTNGKYGIVPNSNSPNYLQYGVNSPHINVFAPSWRNLLANVRWNYQTGGALGGVPAWDNYLGNTGTAVVTSGTFSLSRLSSGNGSYYLGTSSTSLVRGQQVPLNYRATKPTGDGYYQGRGLTAILAGYFRNENGDTNDTATLKVLAYQFNPTTVLASNSATITPATANWTYREVALAASGVGALPSGTAALGAEITLTEVATGGTTAADSRATELRLFVGQFASDTTTLLANPSFDAGTTASWTVDSGGFIVVNTIASPSLDYVQGGAFASSQIHQDWAIPTGFEYGTAILRCFRAQTLANDAGTVTVQVLDSLNNVLASATTGSETMASLNIWYGRTLYVDTVDGAAKIRVIFIATRSLGSGNSGACLDEANLMFAKRLDASYSNALTFDTPSVQQVPQTWQEYHIDYPSNVVPDYVYGGAAPGIDATTEWSDGATRSAGLLNGQFGGGVTGIQAYNFTRIASPNQVYVQPAGAASLGSASSVGAYTASTSFTAICYFRVNEPGFAALCGLFGRMNATLGWGINITAAGQLQAMLRGAGNTTKSVASGRVITEGALHMAALVYDSVGKTLSIYDEQGLGASVSTATGLGDFAALSTSSDCFFRIGTDATDHDSLSGQIGPVFLIPSALDASHIAGHWNYAKDPTGTLTTYTRTASAIVPMAADSNGDTATIMTAVQVALPYHATLAIDGGTGLGLAVGKSATNLIPDVNFAGANWVKDASTVLTQAQQDPTGLPNSVQVAGNATNGIYVQNVPLAASPTTIPFVFWAKSVSGSTTLAVELRTSTGTLESTQNITLTSLWKKYAITLTGWAGGAANARIRFVPAATATFQLAGIMCALQGTDFPAILPLPGATHGAYNATVSGTLPKQLIWEGEIQVQGVGMIDSPTVVGSLVTITGTGTTNERQLAVGTGATGFVAQHYDSAGVSVSATTAYSTYSSRVWKARNRWALCGMLDNITLPVMSAVAWTDDTHTAVTEVAGRTAAWTINTTVLNTIKIGAGGNAPSDLVLRNVTVRAREEKLP